MVLACFEMEKTMYLQLRGKPGSGFCLVSVLPHGGGVWQNFRVGGCPTTPPPPRGGVGLCGGPWVY